MAELLTRTEEARVLRLAMGQPETSGELTRILAHLRDRVVAAALAEESVRRRLDGVRSRVLTVDYREDKPDGDESPQRLAEVVVYDYDRDVLVVAAMHLRSGSLVDLFERTGAPPVTAEELEEAHRLLAEVPQMARALAVEDAPVVAFPAPSYAFSGERARHRGCTVYVGVEDGDDVVATVDLSAGVVVPNEELPEVLRSGHRRRTSTE
jgi:hypothetical protein